MNSNVPSLKSRRLSGSAACASVAALWAQGGDDFDVYSKRKQFVPDFQGVDQRTFDRDMTELVSSDVEARR
jgi:hypothetical protein